MLGWIRNLQPSGCGNRGNMFLTGLTTDTRGAVKKPGVFGSDVNSAGSHEPRRPCRTDTQICIILVDMLVIFQRLIMRKY